MHLLFTKHAMRHVARFVCMTQLHELFLFYKQKLMQKGNAFMIYKPCKFANRTMKTCNQEMQARPANKACKQSMQANNSEKQ